MTGGNAHPENYRGLFESGVSESDTNKQARFEPLSSGIHADENREDGDVRLIDVRLIDHPIIDSLGPSTNVLIHALFLNCKFDELTREDVRKALEDHKDAMSDENPQNQLLSRVRDGKATVNFWIDRLVRNKVLIKTNSKPVVFSLNEGHLFNNTLQGMDGAKYIRSGRLL